jgi:hypothetical protein
MNRLFYSKEEVEVEKEGVLLCIASGYVHESLG